MIKVALPPVTPVQPQSAPPTPAAPSTSSPVSEAVRKQTRKFPVNVWAVVEFEDCAPNLETRPVYNNIGFGDGYYDEDRGAQINLKDVQAYIPAHPGTFIWKVKIPVPLRNHQDHHTWVDLGIQYAGDGTTDAYWHLQAQEELQRWEESLVEQEEIDRQNREESDE